MFGEVLLGETIRLRPVVLDEAEEWLAGEDDEQIRWFEAPGPAPLSNVVRAITEWQASWEVHGGIRHWGIRPVDSDTILGGVELRKLGNEEVNLSYPVFPPYRRRGIAVEASQLAIDYAAREMGPGGSSSRCCKTTTYHSPWPGDWVRSRWAPVHRTLAGHF